MRTFRDGERVRLNDAAAKTSRAPRLGTVLGASDVYASVLWDDGERERVCTRRLEFEGEAPTPDSAADPAPGRKSAYSA